MCVIPNKKPKGYISSLGKMEECPSCGKDLKQMEYDFQICTCGWEASALLASFMRGHVEKTISQAIPSTEPQPSGAK